MKGRRWNSSGICLQQRIYSRLLWLLTNTAGGTVLIGVDDNKSVVGVDNPLDEEERICSLVADNIEPLSVIAIQLYPSQLRPHFIKGKGREQGVFVRLGSTNRQADLQLVEELERTVKGISYDELPMLELTDDALDIEQIKQQFDGIRDITKKDLQTLRLLVKHQNGHYPLELQ